MSSWAAAGVRRRCSLRASVLYRTSLTSELLPEPLTPVTAMNVPSGKATSMFLRLFWRAPLTDASDGREVGRCRSAHARCRQPAIGRHRDRLLAGEILSRERRLRPQHLLRRALGGDLAAAVAGAGAEVEQVVGRGDHFAVVLDQDQRVAQVAQVLQGLRAAGGCRADAGRWSARRARTARRSGRCRSGWPGGCAAIRRRTASAPAGQRQVIQADIDQELQAIADLAQQFAGHLLLVFVSFRSLNSASVSPSGSCAQFAESVRSAEAARRPASSRSREPPQVGQGTSLTRWSSRWR